MEEGGGGGSEKVCVNFVFLETEDIFVKTPRSNPAREKPKVSKSIPPPSQTFHHLRAHNSLEPLPPFPHSPNPEKLPAHP